MPFVHCKFVFNKEQKTLTGVRNCTATKVIIDKYVKVVISVNNKDFFKMFP